KAVVVIACCSLVRHEVTPVSRRRSCPARVVVTPPRSVLRPESFGAAALFPFGKRDRGGQRCSPALPRHCGTGPERFPGRSCSYGASKTEVLPQRVVGVLNCGC